MRSNTHFEKTPFDARRLRCLFLQHTACCLEFVFFLCSFVIADRKSQYRNTGQFASFSPLPQFLPVLSGRLGQGVLRNHSERVLFYFTKKRMGSDVLLCLKKMGTDFQNHPRAVCPAPSRFCSQTIEGGITVPWTRFLLILSAS